MSDPFAEGVEAFLMNQEENPCSDDAPEHAAWEAGYQHAAESEEDADDFSDEE